MEITEVKIKLMDRRNDKLKAFCSITFDNDFVVRDLKVIEGVKGPFVAMPNRKLTDRCQKCRAKVPIRSKFCSECGDRLTALRVFKDERGRIKYYADIAHPINTQCRELIQQRVLKVYQEEVERAQQPDYRPSDIYRDAEEPEEVIEESPSQT